MKSDLRGSQDFWILSALKSTGTNAWQTGGQSNNFTTNRRLCAGQLNVFGCEDEGIVPTISLNPACSAGPRALPRTWLSANISFNFPRSASSATRDSVRLTNRSLGFGRNTSSISETTNIVESVDSGCKACQEITRAAGKPQTWIEKKYRELSKAKMDIFVLLSSLGIRSRFSKSVRVAVATIPGT